MKETGLMFKAPLVRAILAGQKTQTRRVVKGVGHDNCIALRKPSKTKAGVFTHAMDAPKLGMCPWGQPGDRIYVRETWRGVVNIAPPGSYEYAVARYVPDQEHCRRVEYAATQEADGEPWRPAIHMPKWAARIWLEVTGVRVERLQQITEADCIAEGAPGGHGAIGGYHYNTTPLEQFRNIWESTGGDWDANPWVWVVDFKVLSTTGRPA